MKATLRTKILALVLGAVLPMAAIACLNAWKGWQRIAGMNVEMELFADVLQADRSFNRFLDLLTEALDSGKVVPAAQAKLNESVDAVKRLAGRPESGFTAVDRDALVDLNGKIASGADVMALYALRGPAQKIGLALTERAQAGEARHVALIRDQARAANRETQRTLALTVVAIVLTLVAAWLVTRALTRPIDRAVSFADSVSVGDLSRSIEVVSSGETRRLLAALRNMHGNLARIVSEVRAAAGTIKAVSHEIAEGNRDLSRRSIEQKRNVVAAVDAVRDLSVTVNRNHSSTGAAADLVDNAARVAEDGSQEIARTQAQIEKINDSGAKMAEIVEIINGIAFQTNILALNAAVEAARAGEHGRGFAVVATEVRSLSVRSADSARDIKELIADSLRRIGEGSNKVGDINRAIGALVDLVHKVSAIMQDINRASSEQTGYIAAMNTAVHEIEESASHNVGAAEHAVSAVDLLEQHAERLMQLVSSFKLPEGAGDDEGVPIVTERAEPVADAAPLDPVDEPEATLPVFPAKRYAAGGMR